MVGFSRKAAKIAKTLRKRLVLEDVLIQESGDQAPHS
jgi:hypothetical protein